LAASLTLLAATFSRTAFAADADEAKADTNTVVTVQTGKIEVATLRRYVDGFGVVGPAPADANHAAGFAQVSAPVAGALAEVKVWEGEKVEKGDEIAQLDSHVADVAVGYARKTLARQQKLLELNNTSQKAVEDAQQQLAAAEAEQKRLTISAPLSGTVTALSARPGQTVDPNSPVAEITDLSRLSVSAEIPGDEAGPLHAGQAVELLTNPSQTTTLSFVGAAINVSNGAVTVRAAAPENSGLRVGQWLPLRIVVAENTNCLAVPEASVVADEDNNPVLSVVTNDVASRVKVTTGLRDKGLVEVSAPGLSEGTTIVTAGAYGLPAQTKIKLKQAEGQ
jgi:RND family efflux transporter MFP subunit